MIDDFTFEQCKKNREILELKITNLEHAIRQLEKMVAESRIDAKTLTYLRRKAADSIQDLELLYLIRTEKDL